MVDDLQHPSALDYSSLNSREWDKFVSADYIPWCVTKSADMQPAQNPSTFSETTDSATCAYVFYWRQNHGGQQGALDSCIPPKTEISIVCSLELLSRCQRSARTQMLQGMNNSIPSGSRSLIITCSSWGLPHDNSHGPGYWSEASMATYRASFPQ